MQATDAHDQKSKRRHGPLPRPACQLRRNKISVFLTDEEYSEIRSRARSPAAYVRAVVLSRMPPQVPSINIQAYQELARSAANLNQIAHNLNTLWQEGGLSGLADIEDIRAELAEFRIKLLGLKTQFDEEVQ